MSVRWEDTGKGKSEINFDSIATIIDDYKPLSLEKGDFRTRKQSKAPLTVPKPVPSFKFTCTPPDEELLTCKSKRSGISPTPTKVCECSIGVFIALLVTVLYTCSN